jgi:putative acetyltransferase
MIRVIQGDFSDPRVTDLLRIHLTAARAQTAPGSAHALDVAGLQSPEITFWAIWEDETLLGIGALKRLSADHGEVKSMHRCAEREPAALYCTTSSRRRGIAACRG